jgi:hypothetical protein
MESIVFAHLAEAGRVVGVEVGAQQDQVRSAAAAGDDDVLGQDGLAARRELILARRLAREVDGQGEAVVVVQVAVAIVVLQDGGMGPGGRGGGGHRAALDRKREEGRAPVNLRRRSPSGRRIRWRPIGGVDSIEGGGDGRGKGKQG